MLVSGLVRKPTFLPRNTDRGPPDGSEGLPEKKPYYFTRLRSPVKLLYILMQPPNRK